MSDTEYEIVRKLVDVEINDYGPKGLEIALILTSMTPFELFHLIGYMAEMIRELEAIRA